MITYTFDVDMVPGERRTELWLNQYDQDFVLQAHLIARNGDFTIESGTTAAVRGTKPDGNGFSADCTLDIQNGVVTIAGDQQITVVAGKAVFEITLYKGGKELNTANFIVHIERAALDLDTPTSRSQTRELLVIEGNALEIIAAARQAEDAIEQNRQYSEAAQASAQASAQSATDAAAQKTAAETAAGAAAQSAQDAADTLASVQTAVDAAQAEAIEAIEDKGDEVIAAAEAKGQQIQQIATTADQTAAQALDTANNAENHMATLDSKIQAVEAALQDVSIDKDDLGLYYDEDTKFVYPTYKDEPSENGMYLGDKGGGGGGGGGDVIAADFTANNVSGWNAKTVPTGQTIAAQFTWSSVEDDLPTGDGSVRITVNNVVRSTYQVPQGTISVDLTPYLSTGTNKIKIRISDTYDQGQTFTLNVTTIALSISSSFDATEKYTSVITFPFVPVGAVEKTVYRKLDGVKAQVMVTSVSNKQMSFSIPAQTHGAHTLEVWFECEINNETVESNHLYYEFIAINPMSNEVIITSNFNKTSVPQYSNVALPFMVYDPTSLTCEVEIYVNGDLMSTQTVDRTEQSYSYKANTAGTLTFRLESGGTTKTITTNVTESEIDVEAETEDLALYLTSQGRSNNEEHPDTWTYGEGSGQIAAQFSGFNWVSDGWQRDAEDITVMRVSGDARITIPYQIFGTDFRSTGKTIELEFATRNVLNYDATILSCMSGGRGLTVTAQKTMLASEQSEISTQYKEEEHNRIAFVCEKRSENRLLSIYINGVQSGCVRYPDDDDFAQAEPVDISIGSSDCTIDLYNIRIYDNDLTSDQIVDNWIADTQDGTAMLERYTRNNINDAYGKIVIANLPSDLPYMIITCAELPQYKGDKKTCDINFVHPMYPSRSFTSTGVQIDVQGTSSQYYPRKNYKTKHKNGFIGSTGTESEDYAMNTDAIATNSFCYKADFASSEGANNVELAKLYNDTCPYRTPAQQRNSKVRQGIDGFPMVVFWHDTTTDTTSFLGKYNFNNDKGTEEVFGFSNGDESWEILNNTGDRVLWKSADYTGSGYLSDFEARYPDTDPAYTDPAQLASFAEWVVQTDTTAATGDALPEPVTYGTGEDAVTYTEDTAAYRLAKFKYEAGNYMEMQSALFYYLFTELFLMVDSRAKNAFPSFIGSEVVSA